MDLYAAIKVLEEAASIVAEQIDDDEDERVTRIDAALYVTQDLRRLMRG